MQIHIAAETISGDGGLRHYVESLYSALKKHRSTEVTMHTSKDLKRLLGGSEFEEDNALIDRYGLDTLNKVRKAQLFARLTRFIPGKIRKIIEEIDFKIKYLFIGLNLRRKWSAISESDYVILPHVALLHFLIPYYKQLSSKNLILVIHDLHTYFFPSSWPKDKIRLSKIIYPALAKNAKRIIVHNEFTKKSVMRYLHVSEDKISIIPIPPIQVGFYESKFQNDDDYLSKILFSRLQIQRPYVLWASSSTMIHKNHMNLLKAWKIVQQKKKIQLICTGSNGGDDFNKIKHYYKANKIDVIFTNVLTDYEIKILTEQAMFSICPTLFEGGGSGPALEAALLGKPVLCSDIPQLREMYSNRDDLCLYFDPSDYQDIAEKILHALENPQLMAKMANKAKTWITNERTWNEAAKNYFQVILQTAS